MSSSGHESAVPDGYDQAVFDAIASAYYPAAVGAGDAARQRAQAAQSISSAVSAGLIAAIILSAPVAFDDTRLVVAWLAVAAWALAAALYARAVGTPIRSDDSIVEWRTRDQLVRFVLTRALKDRREVESRQKTATYVASVALAATVATFVLATWPSPRDDVPALLLESSSSGETLTKVCGTETTEIRVRTQVTELYGSTSPFRVIIDDDACPNSGAKVVVPVTDAVLVVNDD